MKWTSKLSLRRKITLVIMINTFAALCAAGIAFAEYGVYRFKELRLEDLNALANILGTNSTAPLAFKDPISAQDILQALAAKPHILSAVIYDRDGKPFAAYHRGESNEPIFPPPVESESSRFTSDRVLIFQTITFARRKSGNRVSGRRHRRIQTAADRLFALFRFDRCCRLPGRVRHGRTPAAPHL